MYLGVPKNVYYTGCRGHAQQWVVGLQGHDVRRTTGQQTEHLPRTTLVQKERRTPLCTGVNVFQFGVRGQTALNFVVRRVGRFRSFERVHLEHRRSAYRSGNYKFNPRTDDCRHDGVRNVVLFAEHQQQRLQGYQDPTPAGPSQ